MPSEEQFSEYSFGKVPEDSIKVKISDSLLDVMPVSTESYYVALEGVVKIDEARHAVYVGNNEIVAAPALPENKIHFAEAESKRIVIQGMFTQILNDRDDSSYFHVSNVDCFIVF